MVLVLLTLCYLNEPKVDSVTLCLAISLLKYEIVVEKHRVMHHIVLNSILLREKKSNLKRIMENQENDISVAI